MEKSDIKSTALIIGLVFVPIIMVLSCAKSEDKNGKAFERKMGLFKELETNAPYMVDEFTRLDKSFYSLTNNVFQHNYTLVSTSKDEIDVEALKIKVKAALLTYIKSKDKSNPLKANKVTMRYLYRDKNDVDLFTIEFTHEEYTNQ